MACVAALLGMLFNSKLLAAGTATIAILATRFGQCRPVVSNTDLTVLPAALAKKGTINPSVEEYYSSLESRLGYWIILGNARHCGLWEAGTVWPFPISRAQRAMEEKLYQRLGLSEGSKVLDTGAGSGLVAAYLAEMHGLQITGIDLTPVHVRDAQRTIESRGLQGQVSVQLGDCHDLSSCDDATFDGIYTMETLFTPTTQLRFFPISIACLNPGGVLVLMRPTSISVATFSKMSFASRIAGIHWSKAHTNKCW